jgi:hypothetical protein
MPRIFTPRLGLQTPAQGDTGWQVALDANRQLLDGLFLGNFAVRAVNLDTTTGLPQDKLYRIAGGTYLSVGSSNFPRSQIPVTVTGSGDLTAVASNTTYTWLKANGSFGSALEDDGGYGATDEPIHRLARITTNASRIVSITDDRFPALFYSGGEPSYYRPSGAQGGLSDGSAILALGTYTSTFYTADAAPGPITATLPAVSASNGSTLIVKKIDGTANAVTLNRAGSDTIDGGASVSTTTPGGVIRLYAVGPGKWYTV